MISLQVALVAGFGSGSFLAVQRLGQDRATLVLPTPGFPEKR